MYEETASSKIQNPKNTTINFQLQTNKKQKEY